MGFGALCIHRLQLRKALPRIRKAMFLQAYPAQVIKIAWSFGAASSAFCNSRSAAA